MRVLHLIRVKAPGGVSVVKMGVPIDGAYMYSTYMGPMVYQCRLAMSKFPALFIDR